MAFAASGLAYIAGANNGGPRIWSYTTSDAKATVDTSGYFNTMSADLIVGDMILAKVSDGYGVFVVVSNSGGVVDTGDMVSFQSADTD